MRYFAILLFCFFMTPVALLAQVDERFKKGGDKPGTESEENTPQPPKKRSADDVIKVKDPETFWDKLVYGGDLSVSFGSYTSVYLAPTVGYRFSDKLVAGPGFIYQYYKLNEVYDPTTRTLRSVEGIENTLYGPKAFVNYLVVSNIYLGSQFELLNHDYYTYQLSGPPEVDNRWSPVLFLEGGFRQKIGRKGYMLFGLRYNILHDHTSPYASPWFPAISFML